jgi:hypothetical protein
MCGAQHYRGQPGVVARPSGLAYQVRPTWQGVVGVVFCVLFTQRGREKSAKGAYLEISSSSKH